MPCVAASKPQPSAPIRGLDYTAAMRDVCQDLILRTPELGHLDLTRIAVSFSQARKAGPHGMFASLTPLRFAGGAETTVRWGRPYGIQRFRAADGREFLYILCFCLPRFADLCLREKLITILHELWHISPKFNGDIRRHEGRCYVHTSSQTQFDAAMGVLADHWLAQEPPQELPGFLQLSFADLQQRYGALYGLRLPRPKLLPHTPEIAAT